MPTITWKDTPPTWTALLNEAPICTLKKKDIGGFTASWNDGRLWPAPSHLPKAQPQQVRFFNSLDEAKASVEQALKG